MKKVLILGVLAIGIVIFAYYSLFGSSPKQSDTQTEVGLGAETAEESANKDTPEEPRTGIGTLAELNGWNEDLECTLTSRASGQETPVEGTYFISGDSMRGDFLTESPDLSGQVLSSMIIDGSDVYVWSKIEGEEYGIKMDTSMMDNETVQANEPISLEAEVKYNCKVWHNVDKTVFVPPAEVLFQDMSEVMKGGMEEGMIYKEENNVPF